MTLTRIVLHIGLEKTGSTSIQQTFASNRETLKATGCYYPRSLGISNHTKLAIYAGRYELGYAKRFLNIDNDIELDEWRSNTKKQLLAELQQVNAEQLVLSCEWLAHSLKQQDEFDRLSNLLSLIAPEVKIVIYLRRQDELAVSRYSTALKAGATEAFKFPTNSSGHAGLYDFNTIYQTWLKHFSNVVVRIFERQRLHKQDLIMDMFNLCDIDTSKTSFDLSTREDNVSLSKEGQAVLLEFNRLIAGNTPDNIKLGDIRRYRSFISEQLPGKHFPCTKQEAMDFVGLFYESNEKLKSALFTDQESLFSQHFEKYAD